MAWNEEKEKAYQAARARRGLSADGSTAEVAFTPSPAPQPGAAPPPTPAGANEGPEYRSKYAQAALDNKPYPQLFDMPELGLASSLPAFKTHVAKTFGANADQVRQLLEKDLGLEVHSTPDGFMSARSKKDGKEYVWQSGAIQSDDLTHGAVRTALSLVPGAVLGKIAAGASALAPIAKSILAAAPEATGLVGSTIYAGADAAANEAAKGAVGLPTDYSSIPGQALAGMIGTQTLKGLGKGVTALVGPTVGERAALDAAEQAQRAARPASTARETLMRAARGDEAAQQAVAQAHAIDPAMQAATNELGITDKLPVTMHGDTRNPATAGIMEAEQKGASAALPGTKTQQDLALGDSAAAIRSKLESVGAEPLDSLTLSTRGAASKRHEALAQAETALWEKLYPQELANKGLTQQQLKEAMNKSVVRRPEEVMSFIKGYAQEHNLRKHFPLLVEIRDALTRKQVKDASGRVVRNLDPDIQTLNKYRKLTGEAGYKAGLWKDEDRGLMKQLNGLLDEAYEQNMDRIAGAGATQAAKAATTVRKDFERDLTNLFGEQLGEALQGDIGAQMVPALRGATAGNLDGFMRVVGSMEKMDPGTRERVVLSGLAHMMENANKGHPFSFNAAAKLAHQLDSKPTVKTAIMGSIGTDARKAVEAAFHVAKQVEEVTGLKNKTGNAVGELKLLADADTALGRLVTRFMERLPHTGATVGGVGGVAGGGGLLGGTVGTAVGTGAGYLLQRMLRGTYTTADQALDAFLTSPALPLVIKAGTGQIPVTQNVLQKITAMPAFKRIAVAAKIPPSEGQKWLGTVLRSGTNVGLKQKPPTPDEEK